MMPGPSENSWPGLLECGFCAVSCVFSNQVYASAEGRLRDFALGDSLDLMRNLKFEPPIEVLSAADKADLGQARAVVSTSEAIITGSSLRSRCSAGTSTVGALNALPGSSPPIWRGCGGVSDDPAGRPRPGTLYQRG